VLVKIKKGIKMISIKNKSMVCGTSVYSKIHMEVEFKSPFQLPKGVRALVIFDVYFSSWLDDPVRNSVFEKLKNIYGKPIKKKKYPKRSKD